ncbi:MAG: phosphate signaling complex protein PhoU [Methanomicrobiaceae archaeon]|nr:phosphate signaling complex protein PhoU [Methanomicrobiaceae archaeon]
MVEKFYEELDALKAEIPVFARFAIGMLEDSITTLKNQDVGIAEDIRERKANLAEEHTYIEEEALRILALYQPMAKDLRVIACINQMNYSLYRVGRIGWDIAKLSMYVADQPFIENLQNIFHMGDLVVAMLRDVMEVYGSNDVSSLIELSKRDDVVDNLRSSIFRECLTYMMEDNRNIPRCIDYISVSRHLERAGDHACLIAEKIYYMDTGERVEIR